MNKISKKIDIYFMLIILISLIVVEFFFFYELDKNIINFIMVGCMFFVITISYFKGRVVGLLGSVLIVFSYSTYNAYNNFVLGKELSKEMYFWIIIIPAFAYMFGKFFSNINLIQNDNLRLREEYKDLVTVDRETGLNNLKAFYLDLDREISKSKRHDANFSIVLIKMPYYNEILKIVGEKKMNEIINKVTEEIEKRTRLEDVLYYLQENMLAVIMPYTDKKGAEVVKSKIKDKVEKLNLQIKDEGKNIDLDVRVVTMQYTKDIKNAFEFKEIAERDLEYEV